MNEYTIMRRLGEIADELDELQVRVEELYAERLALWQDGQQLPRKLLHRELAEPSRVTEGAVTQALRKVRLAG